VTEFPKEEIDEAIQLRAAAIDLGIQAMLATNANMYNFLVAARQLYFIAVAGLKNQLTPDYFKQFLPPGSALPTEEELQIVLNAVCNKTTETPEYPSSLYKHYKFMSTVFMPWLHQAVAAEQSFIEKEIRSQAEARLRKEIELEGLAIQSQLGIESSISRYLSLVKRKKVISFAAKSSHLISIMPDLDQKLKTYAEASGLTYVNFTNLLPDSKTAANLFEKRADFNKKTLGKLFANCVDQMNAVPDIVVVDLHASFVSSVSQLQTVKREFKALVDNYGMAVILLVNADKITDKQSSTYFYVE